MKNQLVSTRDTHHLHCLSRWLGNKIAKILRIYYIFKYIFLRGCFCFDRNFTEMCSLGLAPVRRQAIIWTSAGYRSIYKVTQPQWDKHWSCIAFVLDHWFTHNKGKFYTHYLCSVINKQYLFLPQGDKNKKTKIKLRPTHLNITAHINCRTSYFPHQYGSKIGGHFFN